jgi:hypothetical protein
MWLLWVEVAGVGCILVFDARDRSRRRRRRRRRKEEKSDEAVDCFIAFCFE